MVHGKGREVSCLHCALGPANHLAGPVWLRQDRGAPTLKAAQCRPRRREGSPLPLHRATAWLIP